MATKSKVSQKASQATPGKASQTTPGKAKSAKSLAFDDDVEGLRERNVTRIATRALHKFDKRGVSNFTRLAHSLASTMLSAFLGFMDPKKRRREYLIPKDKAAWLEWLVYVARKRVNVEYLTDKELRKVIIRARPNLSPYKKSQGPIEDPALPPCIDWDENQVGDWIASVGWPQLRETFVKNYITGRRLVLIDCAALNKMGMSDLDSMRDVAGKIRELLGTPPPNGLRPIVRVAPFERFLRRKVYNGRSYDEMTFEKFCEIEGFNFEFVADNKNAQIPCTCEVIITTPEQAETDDDGEGDSDGEDHSLKNAPTVEYLVRNAIVRNRTIDEIMKDILENVFLPPRERKYGKEVWGSLKRGLGEGYDDLHLYYPKDRLQFASGVAHHLLDELYKTVAILNDISQLEKHIKEDISPEDLKMFQDGAMILMEEAAPIASLLALGELDLESIFKTEPTFERYVDDVIDEAEKKTNELVPDASTFVDEVIAEAWNRIPDMNLSGLNPELRSSILKMANEILHGISEHRDEIVDSVKGDGKRQVGSPKGKDAKLTFKQQQQPMKRKQSTANTPTSSKSSSGRESRSGGDAEKLLKSEESSHSATSESKAARKSESSRKSVPASRRESRKSVDKTASGNVDDKETTADVTKPAKGKGKKLADKEKSKKAEQAQALTTGAGEGGEAMEGEDEGEEEEDVQASPSVTVNVAEIELDNNMLKVDVPSSANRSAPSTAMSLRISLGLGGERKGSPLPRSPMTVSTPTGSPLPQSPRADGKGSLGPTRPRIASTPTRADGKDSTVAGRSAPAAGVDGKATVQPTSMTASTPTRIDGKDTSIQRSRLVIQETARKLVAEGRSKGSFGSSDSESAVHRVITPIINTALAQQRKKPAIAGPVRPPTKAQPVVPKVNKVPVLSRDQARLLELESKTGVPATVTDISVAIHGPPAPAPASGVSPRQGKALPPSQHVYNQLKQQHELRKQQQMSQATPGEPPKQITYHQKKGVLLGKGEKDPTVGEIFEADSMATLTPQATITPSKAGKLTNFLLIPNLGKQMRHHTANMANQKSPNNAQSAADGKRSSSADPQKRASRMSEGAQKIWQQMKEQYEKGKIATDKTTEDVAEPPAETPESKIADDLKAKRSTKFHPHFQSELIIDHDHIMEMKEHRDLVVEEWAKKHSIWDPLDPKADKEETKRLVRITADKVVTEICTMALTHLLLEAEAGKNTQRIMDVLKRLKDDAKNSGQEGILLWNSGLQKESNK